MSHDPLEDYPLSYNVFYAELPNSSNDYLNDIDPAILDAYDADGPSPSGLSHEQVSQIAQDSLGDDRQVAAKVDDNHPTLFPPDSHPA